MVSADSTHILAREMLTGMASCLDSLKTQWKSHSYEFRKQPQAVGMVFINGRLAMDAKTGDSSTAIALLHRTTWSLPHQEHKTSKREQSAGREKAADSRRAGSVKGAQHKGPQGQGHQLRCCMCMAGKQPCKTRV